MDRPMKRQAPLSQAEWNALLAQIESHSQDLESHLAKSNSNLIEALAGLEELETLTQASLAIPQPLPPSSEAPATSLSEAQATAMPAAPTHTAFTPPPSSVPPRAPVQYKTSKQEYAPALQRNELVEALLQYQRQKNLRPQGARVSPAGSTQAKTKTPDAPTSNFSQMKFPQIQAEPKAAPLGRAAAPSVRLPVLRLKPEGSSGSSDDHSS